MPLTAEQKAANREARRERDRAHRERRKSRAAAEAAGLAAIAATGVGARIAEAEAAERSCCDARDLAFAALQREREELDRRHERLREEWGASLRAARSVTMAAYDERRGAEEALRRRLDEEFPDLVGDASWSAAVWAARRAKGAQP